MRTNFTEASISGTGVYIIKLSRPMCHARYYVGYSVNVQSRLYYHRIGKGCHFTRAMYEKHISFEVIAFIPSGTRTTERRIKNYKDTKRWLKNHIDDPEVMGLRGYIA